MKFRALGSMTAVVLFATLAISFRIAAVAAAEKQDRASPNTCVRDCFAEDTLSLTGDAAQSPQKVSLKGVSSQSCRPKGQLCKASQHNCCPGLTCQVIYVGPCRVTGAPCPGLCVKP